MLCHKKTFRIYAEKTLESLQQICPLVCISLPIFIYLGFGSKYTVTLTRTWTHILIYSNIVSIIITNFESVRRIFLYIWSFIETNRRNTCAETACICRCPPIFTWRQTHGHIWACTHSTYGDWHTLRHRGVQHDNSSRAEQQQQHFQRWKQRAES